MGIELALDVNVICLLILGLCLLTALVGPVVAGVSCVVHGPGNGRGEMRRAQADALEAEAAAAAAAVAAADAVIVAAQVRLLREHPERFT